MKECDKRKGDGTRIQYITCSAPKLEFCVYFNCQHIFIMSFPKIIQESSGHVETENICLECFE
jgi:hypothetical protein